MHPVTEYIISHLPEEKPYWLPYEVRNLITENFFFKPTEAEEYLKFKTNGIWTIGDLIKVLDKVWSDICENEGISSILAE